jgi:hypothetical protein
LLALLGAYHFLHVSRIRVNCNRVVTRWQYTFNDKQNNTNNNQTTQITNNVEECGPCPVLASFTLAFALQLRKRARKNLKSTEKCGKNIVEQGRPQMTIWRMSTACWIPKGTNTLS